MVGLNNVEASRMSSYLSHNLSLNPVINLQHITCALQNQYLPTIPPFHFEDTILLLLYQQLAFRSTFYFVQNLSLGQFLQNLSLPPYLVEVVRNIHDLHFHQSVLQLVDQIKLISYSMFSFSVYCLSCYLHKPSSTEYRVQCLTIWASLQLPPTINAPFMAAGSHAAI